MTANDVIKVAKDKNVRFIKLWFTDILGFAKSFSITKAELEGALSEGMGFDGSSIQGFARIDESDMIAKPDPSTFTILPWRPKDSAVVAKMFCDIYEPDGTPYKGDPRYVLKRNLKIAEDMGFTAFNVGPELEYFYFKSDQGTETLDKGGYFDLTTLDEATDLRRDTILTLEEMGIKVEYSHHEVAPSQHEIDLKYNDALKMADSTITYRIVVKEVARENGVYATFMPKPIFGVNGSGMHVHQSLFKGKKNAFYNAKDKYFLSNIAKHYIAGMLRHARELTLVTSQWVNSYKRLVPGYEAPVYIACIFKAMRFPCRQPDGIPLFNFSLLNAYLHESPALHNEIYFLNLVNVFLNSVTGWKHCVGKKFHALKKMACHDHPRHGASVGNISGCQNFRIVKITNYHISILIFRLTHVFHQDKYRCRIVLSKPS